MLAPLIVLLYIYNIACFNHNQKGCIMAQPYPEIPAAEIREYLHYNPSSGIFIKKWRDGYPYNGRMAGRIVGDVRDNGYVYILLSGKTYRAHRLAWVMQTGRWPKGEVDHINGNRSDNRWENLRESTRQENARNRAVISKSNTSGVTGVLWRKLSNKWQARIMVDNRDISLGFYKEKQDAIDARKNAEEKYFGKFKPSIS